MYPTPNAGDIKREPSIWEVDDIEHEVADLKSRGVKFENYDTGQIKTKNGIAEPGDVKAAWFKDTEGNTMALIQAGK